MADLTRTAYKEDEDYGSYGTPDALPIGDYKLMIVDSEMRETKSGTGEYLRLVFEVIEGEHKGRKLFENLNLINENPIAVRIANAELKAISQACGGIVVTDSQQLHNIPMIAKVGQRKREDTGDMQNDLKRFFSVQDKTATASKAAAKSEGGREAPWKQK